MKSGNWFVLNTVLLRKVKLGTYALLYLGSLSTGNEVPSARRPKVNFNPLAAVISSCTYNEVVLPFISANGNVA